MLTAVTRSTVNRAGYYQRVPSHLAVRQFSNDVGLEIEQFFDSALAMPVLNNTCAIETSPGVFSAVSCHLPQGTGAEPGVILDGSQDVRDFIEGVGLTFSDATNGQPSKLPRTEEWVAGHAWEVNDYTADEPARLTRQPTTGRCAVSPGRVPACREVGKGGDKWEKGQVGSG